MRSTVGRLTLFGLLASPSGGATAAPPPRLAVLPVLGEVVAVSDVFAATEQAAELRAVRVMSVNEYFSADGGELSARAARCGGDTRCLADALAAFRADLGLVVIADASVAPPLLALLLVNSGGEVVAERYGTLEGSRFLRQLTAETTSLFDVAGLERRGRLDVAVTPADATVRVSGQSPELGSQRYLLKPGTYAVQVDAEGHQSRRRRVDIAAGDLTRLDIRLQPQSSLFSSPWLWAGVAVVAVGAATAGVALAVDGSNQSGSSACLCVDGPSGVTCLSCR